MPAIASAPFVPANRKNVVIPAGISAWFRSRCPDGSLDEPVEMGNIGNVEFTPDETVQEIKSSRAGTSSIIRRIISETNGTLTLVLRELVGTNLLLLLRPVTQQTLTGTSGALLYEQEEINLDGVTEVSFGAIAQAVDPTTGLISQLPVLVISVEGRIQVGADGRGTLYAEGVDYVLSNVGGTANSVVLRGALVSGAIPTAANTSVDGEAFVDYKSLTGDRSLVGDGEVFTGQAVRVPYDSVNDQDLEPTIGEEITGFSGPDVFGFVVGWEKTTATTGNVYVAGVEIADVADNDVITGGSSTLAFTVNGAAAALVFTTMSGLASNFSTSASASGKILVTSVATLSAGVALDLGTFGSFVGEESGVTLSATAGSAAPNAELTTTPGSIDGTTGVVTLLVDTLTGSAPSGFFPGQIVSDGANFELLVQSASGAGTVTGVVANTIRRTAGSAITDGQSVLVKFSYRRDAYSYTMLDGQTLAGQLQIQVLARSGPQWMYVFPEVEISVEGNITISSENPYEATIRAAILPDNRGVRGRYFLFAGYQDFALTDCGITQQSAA